jgi:hypothetical protein
MAGGLQCGTMPRFTTLDPVRGIEEAEPLLKIATEAVVANLPYFCRSAQQQRTGTVQQVIHPSTQGCNASETVAWRSRGKSSI